MTDLVKTPCILAENKQLAGWRAHKVFRETRGYDPKRVARTCKVARCYNPFHLFDFYKMKEENGTYKR